MTQYPAKKVLPHRLDQLEALATDKFAMVFDAIRKPLAHDFRNAERDEAIVTAYRDGGHTQAAIAEAAGPSVSRVSKLIAPGETQQKVLTRHPCTVGEPHGAGESADPQGASAYRECCGVKFINI